MTVAPIDRLENVRASVADVERQMNACRAAGVAFPDVFAWRLLSECISLLGRAEDVPNLIRQAKAEAWDEGYRASGIVHPTLPPKHPTNPYAEETTDDHA